ncbi:RHS domain-containing protein [Streptomyces sp. JJ66]|uniref:putative T7SS-secreted protein n=1 Tax=Streptomyces sp. JJ66 TaxID=2803843 RepID=UPI001C56F38F|nr:RHS repeat-associated core domain-containing protein [Streptomyces sp. JJ66]MBW1601673.1 RHS domain-containing protein [Streptomyces sp. JJ66]
MGFGDWLEDRAEDVGQGIDAVGDWTADKFDRVGWDGVADWTREQSDSAANWLGADVDEAQLGESEDAKKLIHGSATKLRSTAGHLDDFQKAFTLFGDGLKALDSSSLKGEAADAFREKAALEPKKWYEAADACETAATALRDFADTVAWAQDQAGDAIKQYQRGENATETARTAYNEDVAAYNKAAESYNARPADERARCVVPTKPGTFSDPGAADREAAEEKLAEARRQRNSARDAAEKAVGGARDLAPEKPSYATQLAAGIDDFQLEASHLASGFVKGTAGILTFASQHNVLHPYNLTHPEEFVLNLNSTAHGLVQTVRDPLPALQGAWETFQKDPAEGTGRLLPELVGSKGTRLAGSAAKLRPGGSPPSARPHLDRDGAQQHSTPDSRKSSGGTDPIDLATGKMYLPQTDVRLPGSLPLAFVRRVESGYGAGRWFGPSWSSTADQRLEIDATGVVFVTEDGLLLDYPHPAPGVPTLASHGPRWPLEREPDGDYTVTDPDTGHVRRFTGPEGGGDGVAPLESLRDRGGHTLTFEYDDAGTPAAITHSGGYRLRLTTEGGRITALHLLGAGGEPVRIAEYGYTDGNLTSVTGSSGLALRFAYDDERRVIAWTDTNDRRYDYVYDHRDRCIAEGGTEGHLAVRLSYGPPDERTGHHTTTLTTSGGHTTRHVFDRDGHPVAVTDPLGHTVRTEHDARGRLLAHTDALGRTTRLERDAEGRPTSVTLSDGRRTEVEYGPLGRPVTVTGLDGTTWRYGYDARGNRTEVTDPAGAVTRYAYDAAGHLSAVTDPLGAVTRVECDAAGLPVRVTDPLGGVTSYGRDAFGRVTVVVDPLGATTRLTWNPEGKLLRRVAPDGTEEQWTYDGEGNRTSHTDPAGGVTTYAYGHFDVLTARTGPDGVRYTFEHDTELRLRTVTGPQGQPWQYTYDAAGRLTSETDFDGRTLHYTHDAAGRLTARTNALGQTIGFQHGELDEIVRKDADGAVTDFSYDAAGRLLHATGPDSELRYHRDRYGRVKSETVDGHTTSYAYDALSRRVRRTTPMGAVTTWRYDAAGRRTGMTAGGRTLTFDHDAAGHVTARHVGEELSLALAWDPVGRLTEQSLTAQDQHTVTHRAYTYRADGYLTGVHDARTGARSFDLDAAGRVTAVHAHGWTETYAYDESGNQAHAAWPAEHPGTEATGPRAYTGTRITRAGAVRYEHDAAGRLTLRQKTRLSRKPDTWHYTWDAEDRLTAVTTPDGTRWRYRYDVLGRRTAKQRLSADGAVVEEVHFTWDSATLVEQTTTSPGLPHPVTLTWDHDGLHPIAQTERLTDATTQAEIDRRFFAIVTDLVGTPTELVDETGHIAWHTRTTLWGTTTWNRDATTHTPLRFPGQYHDPETGLHYNLHRYYDPETARYTTPDPLGLTPAPNPTTYVHNPHTWTDPLGLFGCPEAETGQRDVASQSGEIYLVADTIAAHATHRGIPGVDDLDVAQHIEDVMLSEPGIRLRDTPTGIPRWAWWDHGTGTMIIREGDQGTFMQPSDGYEYFLKQVRE